MPDAQAAPTLDFAAVANVFEGFFEMAPSRANENTSVRAIDERAPNCLQHVRKKRSKIIRKSDRARAGASERKTEPESIEKRPKFIGKSLRERPGRLLERPERADRAQ